MLTKHINPAILTMAAALALGGTAVAQSMGGMKTEPRAQPSPSAQQAPAPSPPAATQPSQAQQEQATPMLKSVRLSALDQNQIKEVQKQLKNLGFYKAGVDGVLGAQTRAA